MQVVVEAALETVFRVQRLVVRGELVEAGPVEIILNNPVAQRMEQPALQIVVAAVGVLEAQLVLTQH